MPGYLSCSGLLCGGRTKGSVMAEKVGLFEALGNSTNLPTLPGIAKELLEISEWEDVDLSAVANIVRKDVSLTSKILRVVNSAFYGLLPSPCHPRPESDSVPYTQFLRPKRMPDPPDCAL